MVPTLAAQLGTLSDKTLVAWVAPANLTQHGGSALTIDDQNSHFDGIIFGERAAGKWMAGSDGFQRTSHQPEACAAETAGPDTFVQMAIVYKGHEITIYRNGQEYSHHEIDEPQAFGSGSAIVIGLRHIEAADKACFAGEVEDARIYDIALNADQIAALKPGELSDPKPLAWWTFKNSSLADSMGTFPPGKLVGNAHIVDGKLILDGQESWFTTPANAAPPPPPAPLLPFDSPIDYRPAIGALADVIPFYWKGEYHVFYLHAGLQGTPWEHIVSTDLVHWRQLPTALTPSGPANGPDGGCMFTGSVTERNGTFHIFYTGDNGSNPLGSEFVCHATSPDLINWTKHPEDLIAPDGLYYNNNVHRDFRDPKVFYNDAEKCWWMVFFGNSAGTRKGIQGLAVSDDLKNWKFQPPLDVTGGGQECPDLFRIGNLWYLIGGDHYTIADTPRGPFRDPPVCRFIDRPGIYAAKTMFDGKRHIWSGWVWDIPGHRDGERGAWGGAMCLPRELYAEPGGQFYSKPAQEVTALFNKTILSRKNVDVGADSTFDVPDHYMLECQIRLDPKADLIIKMRQQPGTSEAYRFTLSPDSKEAKLSGSGFSYKRPCPVDTSRPIKFQAFVQGTIIECFVNDQYAQTCRGYNYQHGKLAFEVYGGKATLLDIAVRVTGK